MAVTKEELDELIEPKGDLEKVSTVSSDGNTLLTRIPKEIAEELRINKGNKLLWSLNKKEQTISLVASGAIVLDIDKNGSKKKEKSP